MDDSLQLDFRDADPIEDDECARIMYNSFVPIWNHNWFQGLSEPLPLIESTSAPLSTLQRRRLAFYRSWISMVRLYEGDVTIAYYHRDQPTADESRKQLFLKSPSPIAAVTLLLPPYKRPGFSDFMVGWRSGLLHALLGLGARGMWRVVVTFEGNVNRMVAEGLKERAIADGKQERLLFCHGCCRNPQWEGKAPARKLFDWCIRRRWDGEIDRALEKLNGSDPKGDERLRSEWKEALDKDPRTPVWLDTTIASGVRAYEEIGFEVVGECMLETNCDEQGIKLPPNASAEAKKRGAKEAKQRVMVRVPRD